MRAADLTNADLEGAYKRVEMERSSGVKGEMHQLTSNEELHQQASFLQGATMPNGQKYEEWLKSKGHGQD